jgi:ketosteroid isomerase-like protein
MRRNLFKAAFALAFLAAIPAKAADDLKKQVEQLGVEYMACFGKQDPACIAALYTPDGFMVNPMGVIKPSEYYGNSFKAGFTKLDVTTTQVHALGSDAAVGTGTFHVTGKDKDGAMLDASGTWGATYIKEGGKLKVRMLTAAPKPPPAK